MPSNLLAHRTTFPTVERTSIGDFKDAKTVRYGKRYQ